MLAGLLFTGCVGGGGYPQSPGGVVKGYISEVNNGNFQGAANYMIEEEANKINQMSDAQLQQVKQAMKNVDMEVTEIKSEDISGDKATVTADVKMSGSFMGQTGSTTNTQSFELVKKNGQWKISEPMQTTEMG